MIRFRCCLRLRSKCLPFSFLQMIPMMMMMMLLFLTEYLANSLNEEGQALLEMKKGIQDKFKNLQSWSERDANPCKWAGIACDGQGHVSSIDLSNMNLSGNIQRFHSVSANLRFLRNFHASRNRLQGSIPPELGDCSQLRVLDLSTNRFNSTIPSHLGHLKLLRKLYVYENYLYGSLPEEIGEMESLEELVIYTNNISGSIPPSIGNMSMLRVIRAGQNMFSGSIPPDISRCLNLQVLGLAQNMLQGNIPKEFGRLQKLTHLILWENQLDGTIPGELGNCSRLKMLALYDNYNIVGPIPWQLGNLKQLKNLYVYRGSLNGTIPRELGNCTNAVEIDLSENRLSGSIPVEFGRLKKLRLLHLFENHLSGVIPKELSQLRNLSKLDLSINRLAGHIPLEFQFLESLIYLQLFDNELEGQIPPMIGFYSNLSVLDVSENHLTGFIPEHVCRSEKLELLSLWSNQLTGNIPYGVKTCKSLAQLRLGANKLTGSFPVEFTKLANLSAIELNQNRFTGTIPPELGNCKKLVRLDLSNNYFLGFLPPEIGELSQLVSFNISSNKIAGSIPPEIGNCTKLQRLDLSGNVFSGHVPEELGGLVHLELLKLSDNRLSGSIPSSMGGLNRLTELQLGGNNFTGRIPSELGQISSLQIALNLSFNYLSGEIPAELGNLSMLVTVYLNNNGLVGQMPSTFALLFSLMVCNVSYNNLTGPLPPTPLFKKMDTSNFIANKGLCGGSLPNACDCLNSQPTSLASNGQDSKSSMEKIISMVSAAVGGISLTIMLVICWFIKKPLNALVPFEDSKPIPSDAYFFPKDDFRFQDLADATDNFSENAIIGQGACGTVYRAAMPSGDLIAVKRLASNQDGSAMENSFHTEISTLGKIRHRNIVKLFGFCYHQESNFILYEYMQNGSLGEMLHGNICTLDWDTRYKIALGAAEGLRYLHNDCNPHIVHRDIKSTNILLDENFEAHVGDFGLAKIIDMPQSKSMSAVAGSYGYIAPEYAYTMKVTEKCDIYSFGVVMLELLTGRPPVQPLEQGGDLVTWVKSTIQNTQLTCGVFDERLDLSNRRIVEEMTLLLKVALLCTNVSPHERPPMRQVVSMLMNARDEMTTVPLSKTSETPLDEEKSLWDIQLQ